MKRIVLLIVSILCLSPLFVYAELSEDLAKDFSVIEGYVIMQINGEYLVDLDDRSNLSIGDILTVVKPGKKVIHPVSKEVIGSIDLPIGYLEVTRLHSGYSYARALSENLEVKDGAAVKRFEQVPAKIINETQDAELQRQLTKNLPHFNWLGTADGEQPLVTFTITEKSLDVTNAQGDSLHKYLFTAEKQLVSAAVTPKRPFVTPASEKKPLLLQQFANSISDVFEQSNDDRFAEMDEAIIRRQQVDRQGIWMSPNLAGHPIGLAVADLDGDKVEEVATILDGTLKIARVTDGQFSEVAELELPASLNLLSLDAYDLDGNGSSELYISALQGYTPSSLVIEFNGSGYGVTIDRVRFFLRAVYLPEQDGLSLVGQKIGNEAMPYAGKMFSVERHGDSLVAGAEIDLPGKLSLFNFIPFADERNQTNFAYLTRGDYLKVLSASGDELFESSEYFGGSEEGFNTRKEYKDEMLAPIYMSPRMVKMPGDEVLVVQNDGQRMVQRFRKFNKSRIVSMKWNGFNMNEIWRTAAQPGYLADFAVADADNDGSDELVMMVKFKGAGMVGDARSSLVMYELE